jgi:hypothetical protein
MCDGMCDLTRRSRSLAPGPALLGHGIEVTRSREGKGGRRILTLRVRPEAVSRVRDPIAGDVDNEQTSELIESLAPSPPMGDARDGADGTSGGAAPGGPADLPPSPDHGDGQ